MIYRIEYQGVTKPLASWGVVLGELSLGNQVRDELTLRATVAAVDAEPAFSYGETLVLWRDSMRIFSGTVTQLPAIGNGNTEAQEYLVSGPWYQLERAMYLQGRTTWGLVDPEDEESGYVEGSTPTTRVVLSMDTLTMPRHNGTQITQALQYAIDTYGLAIAIGTIDVDLRPPYEEVRDVSVAEVIRRLLRWQPDAVAWWDYSTATPTFHVTPRSAMTPVVFDASAGAPLAEFSLTPRPDLVPAGVYFIFERPVTVTVDEEEVQKISVESQSAGAALGTLGLIVHTFQLANAAMGSGASEPVPTGLATKYYAALSTLHYQGTLLLKERDVSGLVSLGETVNITDARAAWATMNALVQSVTFDFATGETRVEVGPPEQLGPQDFQALISHNRSSGATSNFPATKDDGAPPGPPNPVPPVPPAPGDTNPSPLRLVDIEACEDGTPVTLRVIGAATS